MGVEDAFLHPQHKLCGFLRLVVSVKSADQRGPPGAAPLQFPAPGASCALSGSGGAADDVVLLSEDGFVLSSLLSGDVENQGSLPPPQPPQEDAGAPTPRKQRGKSLVARSSFPVPSSRKRRRKGAGHGGSSSHSPATTPSSRRKKGFGSATGSASVLHQLHALTAHKCIAIECRVIGVAVRGEESARAVVLVDVYLPIVVWSGWQFPRSSAMAASLFRHLRYEHNLAWLSFYSLLSELLRFPGLENPVLSLSFSLISQNFTLFYCKCTPPTCYPDSTSYGG